MFEHRLLFPPVTYYFLNWSLFISSELTKPLRYMVGSPDKEVRVHVFFCCEWDEHLSFWATFKVCECQHVCIILGNIGPGETISWMDAALQEIRVSGQCGTIPKELCLSGRSFL